MNKEKLIEISNQTLENSYAPYSNFPVAAVILMKDGNIVKGVNVENASYGATNCAERSAIYSAISQGYQSSDFQSLAITAKTKKPIVPCGICRQVILEFFSEDAPIYMANNKGMCIETTIQELMPYHFTKKELEELDV